jgi:hypothetical protein
VPAVRIHGGNVRHVPSKARPGFPKEATVPDVRSIRCRADAECAWVMWEQSGT